MKKVFWVVFTMLVAVSCTSSNDVEIGNKTTMEINEVFDAGEVLKGEIITAVFTVKNTGKFPLVISEVKGSCTCTVTDFPREPIAPGESEEIMAQVNTDKTPAGTISKSIRIAANTVPDATMVFVKAKVKRS